LELVLEHACTAWGLVVKDFGHFDVVFEGRKRLCGPAFGSALAFASVALDRCVDVVTATPAASSS
jgi:hypothetical protein